MRVADVRVRVKSYSRVSHIMRRRNLFTKCFTSSRGESAEKDLPNLRGRRLRLRKRTDSTRRPDEEENHAYDPGRLHQSAHHDYLAGSGRADPGSAGSGGGTERTARRETG